MIIVHLNSELKNFSQKRNVRMSVIIIISVYEYKSHMSHFDWTSFNAFNIKEFKLISILTAIFSGATERKRKLKMPEIWN